MADKFPCPNCKYLVEADSKFCTDCGFSLRPPPASADQPSTSGGGGRKVITIDASRKGMVAFGPHATIINVHGTDTCPKSGEPIGPTNRFCRECGARVRD